MGKADNLTQDNLIEEIDFKELSKNCKTEKDLSSLTKQFMKNMIENMLKVNLKRYPTLMFAISFEDFLRF